MPNIVRNRVIVTGPEEDLKAFSEALSTEKGYDDSLYYTPKSGGEKANFGWEVKWDGYKPGKVDFYTVSAWGPPIDDLWFASSEFPRLKFDVFYQGEGPVYGREIVYGGDSAAMLQPETEQDFKELVDLTSYKYVNETPEQFEARKSGDVEFLLDNAEEAAELYEDDTASIIGAWLVGIGALTAYTTLKK